MDFIQSILLRLKAHQSEFIRKRKEVTTSSSGLSIENHKFNFFTKLEKYPSLGFEFSIPKE